MITLTSQSIKFRSADNILHKVWKFNFSMDIIYNFEHLAGLDNSLSLFQNTVDIFSDICDKFNSKFRSNLGNSKLVN